MDPRESLEYGKIHEFFVEKNNITKTIPIINRNKELTSISLSLVDYFVTNYAKIHKTFYFVNKKKFEVHSQYKAQLLDYKKEHFDPFNRGGSIFIIKSIDKTINLKTTFRQLNFLRWALKNKVIQYVEDNSQKIIQEYKEFKNTKPDRKSQGTQNKKILSQVIPKKISVNSSKITVKFK